VAVESAVESGRSRMQLADLRSTSLSPTSRAVAADRRGEGVGGGRSGGGERGGGQA
jgi:hypothetical protein